MQKLEVDRARRMQQQLEWEKEVAALGTEGAPVPPRIMTEMFDKFMK